MAAPQRNPRNTPRDVRPVPAEPVVAPKPVAPARETGWLPDCVYTGEKFESGLAFFADALGRITRFSREAADLAAARRLPGQAALPGLVNGHSLAPLRVLRARAEAGVRPGASTAETALARMAPEDVFEVARMAFTEMLLSGITCVGEFHFPIGAAGNAAAFQVLRAAHEIGIRIALCPVATLRAGHGAEVSGPGVDAFLRELETLRTEMAAGYAADEAWLAVGPASLAAVPLDAFKAIANYAHAQRLRLHTRLASTREQAEAVAAEYGRPELAVLADAGVVDKRFTGVHGNQLTEDACRTLGTARASLCLCPIAEHNLGHAPAPVEALLAAGAGVALGTAGGAQVDLLKDARLLEYALRVRHGRRPAISADAARTLFHSATVAGARSLGATGGALEVGRPADFFTVNLYEPSIAGADPESLLANIVFALERRAVREVWIGARQRIVNGRHPNQGLIVGRFVELQRKLWAAV